MNTKRRLLNWIRRIRRWVERGRKRERENERDREKERKKEGKKEEVGLTRVGLQDRVFRRQ